MASSRVLIRLHHGIFRHGANLVVGTAKVNGCVRWGIAVAVDLDRRGPDSRYPAIGPKRLQGRDFGSAGATHAPGLLQNAVAQVSPRIQALGDIVVAAG